MIFVTVGSQMPFDRLVLGVDRWAQARGRNDVFAQIGVGGTHPSHVRWIEVLTPPEFRQRIDEADLVIAHAGCGTILSALVLGKPLVVMARRGHLRETRNDHQVATARSLQQICHIAVADDEAQLSDHLDSLVERADELRPPIRNHASDELLEAIRDFINKPS